MCISSYLFNSLILLRDCSHIASSWMEKGEGGEGGGGSGKCLCLIMGGGGGERGRWYDGIKANKKVPNEKSHYVCSISLIVLCNNKVNHTLCNTLGYKLSTFLCQYVYRDRHSKDILKETKKVELILVKTWLFFILWRSLILLNSISRSFRKGGGTFWFRRGVLPND